MNRLEFISVGGTWYYNNYGVALNGLSYMCVFIESSNRGIIEELDYE